MIRCITPRSASALALLSLTVLAGGPALAHHSFAMFDRDKKVTVEGTVKQWDWINPHSWLYVVSGNKEWAMEGASLSELARRGWTKDAMKPGDKVSVTINPRKDGTAGGSLISIVLANGKTLGPGQGGPVGLGGAGPGAPAAAPPATN